MNNILISNPFLFRPDSPSSSPELKKKEYFTDFNINFLKSQFNEAWENSSTFKTEAPSSPENSLWSVSSPTISTTSESSNLEELFLMDSSFLNSTTFDFNFNESDCFETITSDLYPIADESESPLTDPLSFPELDISDLDVLDFAKNDTTMELKKKQEMYIPANNKALPTMTVAFHNNALPVQVQNMNTGIPAYQGAENVTTTATVMAAPAMNQMALRGGHRRKEVLEHRMVAASPQQNAEEEEVEKKPDIQALGINNGQQRVTKRRASSVSSNGGPSSSTSANKGSKKPRKYELDVADDPSVRNAKAAKMNRDRKKQENEDMKNQIYTLNEKLSTSESENSNLKEEVAKYKSMYYQERQKNVMSDGIRKNMTNVKKIFESIIAPLNQQFGQMEVDIPDAFGNIPAYIAEDGSVETFVSEGGDFNILDRSFQMTSEGSDSSTYTTIHISPEERKIRLDYNPNFH